MNTFYQYIHIFYDSRNLYYKGGLFSESAMCFSHWQKKIHIPNHYPELEIWISCLLLWGRFSNFKFRIVIWNIHFGNVKNTSHFLKKATCRKPSFFENILKKSPHLCVKMPKFKLCLQVAWVASVELVARQRQEFVIQLTLWSMGHQVVMRESKIQMHLKWDII